MAFNEERTVLASGREKTFSNRTGIAVHLCWAVRYGLLGFNESNESNPKGACAVMDGTIKPSVL